MQKILVFQIKQGLACLVLTGMLFNPALAADDFASTWQPRPLVPPKAAPAVTPSPAPAEAQASPTPSQAEIEKALKPAEPFVRDIEARLYITPETGSTMVQRLNSLQTVLFGEPKFQDAGELLAKLAELFPQEAAKAQAELTRQLQEKLPPAQAAHQPSRVRETYPPAGQAAKPIVTYPPPATAANSEADSGKKKWRFWQNDDDDWAEFERDSFFNDNPDPRPATSSNTGSGAGSTLRGIGQGLAALAMLAGNVAGAYYLNKQLGNATANNPYYGQQPYYGGYGNGYYPAYGAYPPTYGPYGYAPQYSYGSVNPYQQGISPMGVPTGRLY